MTTSRRRLLRTASAAALALTGPSVALSDETAKLRVLVWDEQQPAQKLAYPDFLGNAIAGWLKSRPDIEVRSVRLDDPEQGLSDDNLAWTNVLVWWGHVRQSEITAETARKKIVEPILAGRLSLVALHSAHWSTPFVEAMNERTRQDARRRYPDPRQGPPVKFEFVPPPGRFPPAGDSLLTPAYYALKQGGPVRLVRVDLPNCCFPDYRADGEPSTIKVLKPEHPLARGLPETFTIQHTEMYSEPFHVPEPDEVIFRESWAKGEWFRSGCLWTIGPARFFISGPGMRRFRFIFSANRCTSSRTRYAGSRQVPWQSETLTVRRGQSRKP